MSLNINNEYRRHMTQIEGSSLFDLSLCSTKSHDEHQDGDALIELGPADISENTVREQMPNILDLLLIDRYNLAKERAKEGAKELKIPPTLTMAAQRIDMFTREVERLERQNAALLEQLVAWQYNAFTHGLSQEELNKGLYKIDRGQT